MAPVSVNRRNKLLLELYTEHDGEPFNREQFGRIMRKIVGSDRRTIARYWSDLLDDEYLLRLGDNLARLHPEIVAGEGKLPAVGLTPIAEMIGVLR